MSKYDFSTAYRQIVKASVEKNTKEIPTLLSCANFKNAKCLEIGPGPDARIAIRIAKMSERPHSITCLIKDNKEVSSVQQAIKKAGLEKVISLESYEGIEKGLPFFNKHFDIVYGAWLPHSLFENPKFLDETMRVCRGKIVLLLPGIEGDEPDLVSIVNPRERKRRENRQRFLQFYFRNRGYEVNIKEDILKLEFENEQDIFNVYENLAFHGSIPESKLKKVKDYLNKRVKNFQDGFYVLTAKNI